MPNYRRLYVPGGTFLHLRDIPAAPYLARAAAPAAPPETSHRVGASGSPVRDRCDCPSSRSLAYGLGLYLRGDSRYPLRWMRIKEEFTEAWLAAGGTELPQSASRLKHRQRGVWHKRYWEHTVRDEEDLKRCVDYIHWNPASTTSLMRVCDWKWSSFHRFVTAGSTTFIGVEQIRAGMG